MNYLKEELYQYIAADQSIFEFIQNYAVQGLWIWNLEKPADIWMDKRLLQNLGYDSTNLSGQISIQWNPAIHEGLKQRINTLNPCEATLEQEEDIDYRHAKGLIVHMKCHTRLIIKNGKALRLIGCISVASTQQSLEEESASALASNWQQKLRISENRFEGAFESAAIGMALIGLQGEWIKINRRVSGIIGYTEQELLKLTFQDITYPEDLNIDLYLLQELVSGKRDSYQMEKRYIHKNGSLVWVVLAVSMVKNESDQPSYFVSQIKDITDRKLAEQKLQATLAELRGILEASTQVSIIGTNLKGTITSFNKGAENLLGYKAFEMVGVESLQLIHHPSDLQKSSLDSYIGTERNLSEFNNFIELAKKGTSEIREWSYVRKDGTTFPVQLALTPIGNAEQPTGVLAIAVDISNLKAIERELKAVLEVTNEQNERLVNFAQIVSHNLRSHSCNFSLLIDFLQAESNAEEKETMMLMLKDSSKNLQQTIEHLNHVLAVTSNCQSSLEPVDLKVAQTKALESVTNLVQSVNGVITMQIPDKLLVQVVPTYLDSILNNILSNAIKYRSPSRNLEISIKAHLENNYVVYQVEDNGQGIDLVLNRHKLFGMYKTFHGNSDARGVGLFITKNQVEAMEGKIKVESEVNKGTTFKVFLKAA